MGDNNYDYDMEPPDNPVDDDAIWKILYDMGTAPDDVDDPAAYRDWMKRNNKK